MTEQRADELRSLLRRELMTLDSEIAWLHAAIHERNVREIVIAELLSLIDRQREMTRTFR